MLGLVHAGLEPGNPRTAGGAWLVDRGTVRCGTVRWGLGGSLGHRHRGQQAKDGGDPEDPDLLAKGSRRPMVDSPEFQFDRAGRSRPGAGNMLR